MIINLEVKPTVTASLFDDSVRWQEEIYLGVVISITAWAQHRQEQHADFSALHSQQEHFGFQYWPSSALKRRINRSQTEECQRVWGNPSPHIAASAPVGALHPSRTEWREPLGSPRFVEDTTAHGPCRQKSSSNTIPGDQLQGARSTAGALGAAITSLCPMGRLALAPTLAALKSYSSQRKHFQH